MRDKRLRAAGFPLVTLLLLLSLQVLPALATGPDENGQRGRAPEIGTVHDVAANLQVIAFEKNLWLYRATLDVEGFGPVTSNGLVVAGRDGVWVIDTPWNDELTATLFDWVGSNIGPVRGVVATHSHDDRLGGIGEAHRRDLETWGHTETARLAPSSGFDAPRQTFEESKRLTTGSELFEVFYPGAGHTVDNTVVWFPYRGLLFGGCLLKSAEASDAGNIADADLAAWPASLESVQRRYPQVRTVIPGHGLQGSPALIQHTAEVVAAARQ